jgi:hypothetical protein
MYANMKQWAEIRRRVLVKGVSRRQTLRETGLHWPTLAKILAHSESPGYRQERPLDELGCVPFSETGAELLFDVVSRAYERTSLIVTTNLPFEQWIDVGSEQLTVALQDRLMAKLNGNRLREGKRRADRELRFPV